MMLTYTCHVASLDAGRWLASRLIELISYQVNNQTLTDPFSTPEPLALAEAYPACFDWEHPRPLKINIHQDLMAAGHDRIAVKRALGRYCKVDRYWRALQPDAPRIDLQGQPAGAATEREAA